EEGEAVELGRQSGERHFVAAEHRPLGIALTEPIEAGDLQPVADDRSRRIPVLDMEPVEALAAEDPRLVVALDAEAPARMQPPDPLLEPGEDVGIRAVVHEPM